jgi:hypothetical protein
VTFLAPVAAFLELLNGPAGALMVASDFTGESVRNGRGPDIGGVSS